MTGNDHNALATDGFAWGQRRAQHLLKLFAMPLAGFLQNQFSSKFWQMPFRCRGRYTPCMTVLVSAI